MTDSDNATSPLSFYVTEAGRDHAFFVASVRSPMDAGEAAQLSYAKIAELLERRSMAIVHERIFGSLSKEHSVMAARSHELRSKGITADNPVTYVQGQPTWGDGVAGVIIHAVASSGPDGDLWTITDEGRACGRGWRRYGTTFLALQNIQGLVSGHQRTTRPLEVRRMIERAERILRAQGASYLDVVRTWLYISDILDWYAEFNKVRSEKYGEFGIMPGPDDGRLLLPASTGISGDSPSGCACSMDLIAVAGEGHERSRVKRFTNARQLDAFRYGSAFSRATLVHEQGVSLFHVSGTAAIDEHGESLFLGDVSGQIERTFENVEALMGQVDGVLGDIAAATVFVKRPEDAALFWEMAAARRLERFPAVCVVGDVCRDELLFEIDAEAVIQG